MLSHKGGEKKISYRYLSVCYVILTYSLHSLAKEEKIKLVVDTLAYAMHF